MTVCILDPRPERPLVRWLVVARGRTVFMVWWRNRDARDRVRQASTTAAAATHGGAGRGPRHHAPRRDGCWGPAWEDWPTATGTGERVPPPPMGAPERGLAPSPDAAPGVPVRRT
jgi:hypothetical protein